MNGHTGLEQGATFHSSLSPRWLWFCVDAEQGLETEHAQYISKALSSVLTHDSWGHFPNHMQPIYLKTPCGDF